MERLPVAILGCTGLVGQQFVRLLSHHPFFEVILLTASSQSAGKTLSSFQPAAETVPFAPDIQEMKIAATSPESIIASGAKTVFSALPASAAPEIENELRRRGLAVFSNASHSRLAPDVPILIPEVNPEHLELAPVQKARHSGFLVANSNCSTSGLVLVLGSLLPFGIASVTVTTFQSISGAGRHGLAAIDITGNVIPYIASEEKKIEVETQKILGRVRDSTIESARIPIYANCCRVPVRVGHLESVTIELEQDADPTAINEAISAFRGIPQKLQLPTAPEKPLMVRPENDRPQPLLDLQAGMPERARGMTVSVGRIRKKGDRLSLFLLVNNIIRGAAGTSVLSAELAYHHKLLPG